jgi:hypothetical protein
VPDFFGGGGAVSIGNAEAGGTGVRGRTGIGGGGSGGGVWLGWSMIGLGQQIVTSPP